MNEEILDQIDTAFYVWWHDEGSGLRPKPDEDTETHVLRVSKIAWENGAYKALNG